MRALLSITFILTATIRPLTATSIDSQADHISFPAHPITQLVFFAVLEGLYEDGVSNEAVDRIIPPDKEHGGYIYTEHFIYGCPMCSPAFEAFRLYRSREKLAHLKPVGFGPDRYLDTFGKGLSEEVFAQLKSPDRETRLKAIEGLINIWVDRRITAMRLSSEERQVLVSQLEAGKEKGGELLERFKKEGQYGVEATRLNCAVCKGAAEGGSRK